MVIRLFLGNVILIVVVYIQCADTIAIYGVFVFVLLGSKCDIVGEAFVKLVMAHT